MRARPRGWGMGESYVLGWVGWEEKVRGLLGGPSRGRDMGKGGHYRQGTSPAKLGGGGTENTMSPKGSGRKLLGLTPAWTGRAVPLTSRAPGS